jgi:uncharacterized protein
MISGGDMRLNLMCFAVCSCLFSGAAAGAIDCSRAVTNVDKLICSSSRAAIAENQMAYSYREALRRGVDPQLLSRSQREWQEQVRDLCNDVSCLVKAYDERGAEIDNY